MSHLTEDAVKIFHSAVESVKPASIINQQIQLNGNALTIKNQEFDLSGFKNIYVIGLGKAAAYMASSLEEKIGDWITEGAVLVKYGHGSLCNKMSIYEGGHP